jgi:hypothetical protein
MYITSCIPPKRVIHYFQAPTIVVPLSFEEETSALLLDFGHLSLRSDLSADKRRKERERERNQLHMEREKAGTIRTSGEPAIAPTAALEPIEEEDFYSKFVLRLTSLQAFVVSHEVPIVVASQEEEELAESAARRQQIIEKFNLHFIIRLNKLKSTALTSTRYAYFHIQRAQISR